MIIINTGDVLLYLNMSKKLIQESYRFISCLKGQRKQTTKRHLERQLKKISQKCIPRVNTKGNPRRQLRGQPRRRRQLKQPKDHSRAQYERQSASRKKPHTQATLGRNRNDAGSLWHRWKSVLRPVPASRVWRDVWTSTDRMVDGSFTTITMPARQLPGIRVPWPEH